jgi:hypothetical protein
MATDKDEIYKIEEDVLLVKKIKISKEIVTRIPTEQLLDAQEEATSRSANYNEQWATPEPRQPQMPQTITEYYYPPLSSSMTPQVFECKYLGKWPCNGVSGMRHIRDPIEQLVANAKRLSSANELQVLRVTVSDRDFLIEPLTNVIAHNQQTHPSNAAIFIPIGNISYAAQDSIYTKIFAIIVVANSPDKALECFAFLCSSSDDCRRIALAMTTAFQAYAEQLKQQPVLKQTTFI